MAKIDLGEVDRIKGLDIPDNEKLDLMEKYLVELGALEKESPMKRLAKKWAPKLEPFKNDEHAMGTLAMLLENQYNYEKGKYGDDSVLLGPEVTKDILDKPRPAPEPGYIIDIRKQLEEKENRLKVMNECSGISKEVADAMEKEKEKIKGAIKKTKEKLDNAINKPFTRGVNLIDETVKFYDCLDCKYIVGVQAMCGPVGLSYALRFRENTTTKTFSETFGGFSAGVEKEEVDRGHGGPGEYERKKEDIPELEPATEQQMTEIMLTVEQKEVLGQTLALNTPRKHKKLNGEVFAAETDSFIFRHIIELVTEAGNVSDFCESTFAKDILNISDGMHKKSHFGGVNVIVAHKNHAEIFERLEKVGMYYDGWKLILTNNTDEHSIICAHKGSRENACGYIYCPYVPIMVSSPDQNLKTFTRHGFTDLHQSSNYYHILKI
jgi:hypothetical protein